MKTPDWVVFTWECSDCLKTELEEILFKRTGVKAELTIGFNETTGDVGIDFGDGKPLAEDEIAKLKEFGLDDYQDNLNAQRLCEELYGASCYPIVALGNEENFGDNEFEVEIHMSWENYLKLKEEKASA